MDLGEAMARSAFIKIGFLAGRVWAILRVLMAMGGCWDWWRGAGTGGLTADPCSARRFLPSAASRPAAARHISGICQRAPPLPYSGSCRLIGVLIGFGSLNGADCWWDFKMLWQPNEEERESDGGTRAPLCQRCSSRQKEAGASLKWMHLYFMLLHFIRKDRFFISLFKTKCHPL